MTSRKNYRNIDVSVQPTGEVGDPAYAISLVSLDPPVNLLNPRVLEPPDLGRRIEDQTRYMEGLHNRSRGIAVKQWPHAKPDLSASDLEKEQEELGEQLFEIILPDLLFQGAVHSALNEYLRLRIRIDPTASGSKTVSKRPWEFALAPEGVRNVFPNYPLEPLATHEGVSTVPAREGASTERRYKGVSIVRCLNVAPYHTAPLRVSGNLKVLVVLSNPKALEQEGYCPLDISKEEDVINKALKGTPGLELRVMKECRNAPTTEGKSPTLSDLEGGIREFKPHILHFVGHGNSDERGGFLVFDSGGDGLRKARRKDLVIALGGSDIRLIFLNACRTYQLAGELIRSRKVPAVITTLFPISDPAAIVLSSVFYTELAKHGQIDPAVAAARRKLSLGNLPECFEWATPAVFLQAEDGVIFDVAEEVQPVTREPEVAPKPIEKKAPPPKPAAPPTPKPVPSPWDDLVEVPGGEFAKGAKKERMEAFLKRLDLLNDHNTEVLTEEKWEEVDLRTLWIQRHPVTNAQYEAFANANPSHTKPAHWNAAAPFYPPEKADHPVVGVCHADAEAYATWVKMRLPTELEWEKAARGTDGRNYPWGDEFDVNRCNTWEAGHGDTVPVRQYDGKGDSPYGCCGMVGNVQEWTATTVEEEELKFAVVKGGSFDMSCQIFGLLHLRRKAPLDLRKEDIGFRCASDSPKRH